MWEDMTYPQKGDDPKKHLGLDDQHDWFHQFTPRGGYIDGVFTITGDTEQTLTDTYAMVKTTFGVDLKDTKKGAPIKLDAPSIQLTFTQQGHVLEDDKEQ